MKRSNWYFYLLTYIYEVFMLSGLILLSSVVFSSVYARYHTRSQITESFTGVKSLLEGLEIYSIENQNKQVKFINAGKEDEDITLCPIREPDLQYLSFLTTPTAYMHSLPEDPFMMRRVGDRNKQTPMMLHWIQSQKNVTDNQEESKHIGWGIFSVGPSLRISPTYNISVLKKVPFQTRPLRNSFYNPSNGLFSIGLIYKDSLGNSSKP